MKIEIRECTVKVAASCTGTFQRKPGVGRPPVSCPDCQAVKKSTVKTRGPRAVNQIDPITGHRICGCGVKFAVAAQGRGARPTKCDKCRTEGKVYRADSEGRLQEIRQETIAREQAELRAQKGRERADNLFMMMQSLISRRERGVIGS